MRTFACFVFQHDDPTPNLTFVIAATLQRAKAIVRRELLSKVDTRSVEICEGAKLLCTEPGRDGEAAEPPG
jgi:hypothetical protein